MIAITPTSRRAQRRSQPAAAVRRVFQTRRAYSLSYFDYGVIDRERHRL